MLLLKTTAADIKGTQKSKQNDGISVITLKITGRDLNALLVADVADMLHHVVARASNPFSQCGTAERR